MADNTRVSIYLKDLIRNPSLLSDLRERNSNHSAMCCGCGIVLRGTITGRRKATQGLVCDDCYYASLGAVVEACPLICAGIRRG